MGRRNSEPDGEGKPKHESAEERDARMDQHYVFDRSEWPNLLAYVSVEDVVLIHASVPLLSALVLRLALAVRLAVASSHLAATSAGHTFAIDLV